MMNKARTLFSSLIFSSLLFSSNAARASQSYEDAMHPFCEHSTFEKEVRAANHIVVVRADKYLGDQKGEYRVVMVLKGDIPMNAKFIGGMSHYGGDNTVIPEPSPETLVGTYYIYLLDNFGFDEHKQLKFSLQECRHNTIINQTYRADMVYGGDNRPILSEIFNILTGE